MSNSLMMERMLSHRSHKSFFFKRPKQASDISNQAAMQKVGRGQFIRRRDGHNAKLGLLPDTHSFQTSRDGLVCWNTIIMPTAKHLKSTLDPLHNRLRLQRDISNQIK